MTQEEKQLLLIDLCARLPYGVRVHIRYKTGEPCYGGLKSRDIQWFIDSKIEIIKPYLRPMSSMTHDEDVEYRDIMESGHYNSPSQEYASIIDWLNEHHFDYRCLIEKGLALEAPDTMYKVNEI